MHSSRYFLLVECSRTVAHLWTISVLQQEVLGAFSLCVLQLNGFNHGIWKENSLEEKQVT